MDEVDSANVSATSLSHSADIVSIFADPTTAVAPSVIDKGKAKVVAEDIPSKKRTKRQMEEDKLGEEAAKRLHDDQQAELAKFHEIKVREVELATARAKQVSQLVISGHCPNLDNLLFTSYYSSITIHRSLFIVFEVNLIF